MLVAGLVVVAAPLAAWFAASRVLLGAGFGGLAGFCVRAAAGLLAAALLAAGGGVGVVATGCVVAGAGAFATSPPAFDGCSVGEVAEGAVGGGAGVDSRDHGPNRHAPHESAATPIRIATQPSQPRF